MELPPAPGPKLGPFQSPHGNTGPPRIEFLKELGQGEYSVVWKVTIDGALFALKLVRLAGSSRDPSDGILTYLNSSNGAHGFKIWTRAKGRWKKQ